MGPWLMIAASACFALMGLCVKFIDGALTPVEIAWWRSLLAAGLLLVYLRRGVFRRIAAWRPLLIRSLFGLASMVCYFYGAAHLPLGDAVLLTFLSPIFVAVISPFALGEPPSPKVWVSLGAGIVGVGTVVDPTLTGNPFAYGVALIGAVFGASGYVALRKAAQAIPPAALVFWYSALGIPVLAPGALPTGVNGVGGLLIGLAVVGVAGQILMTRAYAEGPAARMALFSYASPVFAYGLGALVLDEPLRWQAAVGTLLIAWSGWRARAA